MKAYFVTSFCPILIYLTSPTPEKNAINCSDVTSASTFCTNIVRLISSSSVGSEVCVIIGGGGIPGIVQAGSGGGKALGRYPVFDMVAYALIDLMRCWHSLSSGISSLSMGTTIRGLSMNTVFVRC